MVEGANVYGSKGEEFMMLGDKKIRGGLMDKLFGNKGERAEEACEFYKQAATNFKLAKQWENASNAFLRCLECDKMSHGGEGADFLVQASEVMRKVNTATAIQYMNEAIELYFKDHRISYAAKLKKTIAEIYEADQEMVLAIKAYQEAADLFETEPDNTSNHNQMLLKVAELSSLQKDATFIDAIKVYEKIADKYLENKLTAPSARELFFKAALLHLCNDDSVGCRNGLEKYADHDPSLQSTREYKFALNLVKDFEERNIQNFSDHW